MSGVQNASSSRKMLLTSVVCCCATLNRSFRIESNAGATTSSKFAVSHALASAVNPLDSSRVRIHVLTMLRHWKPSSVEMYRMPARLTVAGVACFRSRISKIMRMCGFRGMRSLDARVRSRLSSMTEFMDSIQFASRSPSSMSHFGSSSGICDKSRKMEERSPSFQSRVAMLMYPYRSCVGIVLGLMSLIVRKESRPATMRFAFARYFQLVDLKAPGGPMTKTQCRIWSSSSSWIVLSFMMSSTKSGIAATMSSTLFWRASSTTRGGSRPGKRSFSRPKKTTSSTFTILAMLKSRSALIKMSSSSPFGSDRRSMPATTSTDLMARRPQS
mmetsp:Transcript_8984/g.26040  ORF Transcript_8984/g.26040 Transcript_8984/m.26040 type:complete len:329 (-) Transcript_8984:5037-6023(-)